MERVEIKPKLFIGGYYSTYLHEDSIVPLFIPLGGFILGDHRQNLRLITRLVLEVDIISKDLVWLTK